jgi:hypothetical protein
MKLKSNKSRYLSLSLLTTFLLIFSPVFLRCENVGKGNIIGFVYDKDGTTPLDGAIVKFLNVTTDAVYESCRTDSNGLFKVAGIENGIYIFGVLTSQGDFVLDDLIGVKIEENETAKLSISLKPSEDIAPPEKGIPVKVEKNSKQEWVIPKTELDLPEQTEILTEEKAALAEFRGIASINAASPGISFGILTSNPDGTMEIACCSPYTNTNHNCGDFWNTMKKWWRRWWGHCGGRR